MNRIADSSVEALSRGPFPPQPPPHPAPLPVIWSISTDYFPEPLKLDTKCSHRSQVQVRVLVTVPTVNKEQCKCLLALITIKF